MWLLKLSIVQRFSLLYYENVCKIRQYVWSQVPLKRHLNFSRKPLTLKKKPKRASSLTFTRHHSQVSSYIMMNAIKWIIFSLIKFRLSQSTITQCREFKYVASLGSLILIRYSQMQSSVFRTSLVLYTLITNGHYLIQKQPCNLLVSFKQYIS